MKSANSPWLHCLKVLRQLQQAGMYLLALSAAVDLKLLNARKADGQFYYARGRYKYLGLGALVIFFAWFAGYGMAHMLASMTQMSATAALLGGVIWGVFQWCLERQMMLALRSDASWKVKIFGLGWRAILAFLSAITLVYPFFVDSNRSEIALRTSQIARQRVLENRQSAALASGLEQRQHEAGLLIQQQQAAEQALASTPPQLREMRQQWQNLRNQARQIEVQQLSAIRRWQQQLVTTELNAQPALQQKIQQAQQRIQQAQQRAQRAEQALQHEMQRWRLQKQNEYAALTAQLQQAQVRTQQAWQQTQALQQQQEQKIQAAAAAGYAADFAASWDMLQHDQQQRWQFIWWLSWFYLIELIAIVVKLTHHTELDARLSANEHLALLDIASQLRLQQAQLALNEQQELTKIQGQMLALQADQGITQAALSLMQPIGQLQQQVHLNAAAESGWSQILSESLRVIQSRFLQQVNRA